MKLVKSDDDFLHVKDDGNDGAEVFDPNEQQQAITQKGIINEIAEDLETIILTVAEQICITSKYEATKGVFFGTVALATGRLQEYLSQQENTQTNEGELEVVAAADIIYKGTEPHTKAKQTWSTLVPSFW